MCSSDLRHLCNLAMFFTHNTQNSLLLLIHVQVQCNLTIIRNTCVDICPCTVCLKENMQRKIKIKKNQSALYMIASVSSRRCRSYRIYLKGDSPHQTIMIVCELK